MPTKKKTKKTEKESLKEEGKITPKEEEKKTDEVENKPTEEKVEPKVEDKVEEEKKETPKIDLNEKTMKVAGPEPSIPEVNTEKTENKVPEPPKVPSFSMLDATKNGSMASKDKVDENTTDKKKDEEDTHKEDNREGQISSEEVKSWLKDVRPDTTKEVEKSGGPNFKLIFLVFFVLLIIGAVVGGIFYFKNGMKGLISPKTSEETTMKQPETVQQEPSPTPTPKEEVKLSEYSVNVLNGSGVAGEAANADGLLKKAGFENTKTGNAGKYDYVKTEVSMKKDTPQLVFDAIKSALGNTYDVVKSDTTLEESSSYDVVVIVGQKSNSS